MNAATDNHNNDQPWLAPDTQAHVQLVNIRKNYGEFTAVDNISLDIYKGEFFSLLGPSGCGKTTLLRMLAGFEKPTQGEILLQGRDISAIPPHRRPFNMMFQSYALFPHMSVENNIAFGLKQDKVPKTQIKQRVSEVVELVQLQSFMQRKPHQLSGGQKQRVALARSLIKKPEMLLLDEPLGALDKKLRQQTQFELMNIQEKLGITFVIVTHDQEEAMTVSSRIAVMDHGTIVQVATPAQIYEYPNSRYVAEFIGDINIFQGKIESIKDDVSKILSTECSCIIQTGRTVQFSTGTTVWVALRPEKLEISKEPPADTRTNCLKGEVWDIGYLGNLSLYHVRLSNGKMVTVARTNRMRSEENNISWEDKVYLYWSESAVVILSK